MPDIGDVRNLRCEVDQLAERLRVAHERADRELVSIREDVTPLVRWARKLDRWLHPLGRG